MSSSEGSDAGGKNEDVEADESTRDEEARALEEEEAEDTFTTAVEDASIERPTPDALELQDEDVPEEVEFGDYAQRDRHDDGTPEDVPDLSTVPATPPQADSPLDSGSIPDDTPSIQGSLISSPGRGSSPLPRRTISRSVSGALQPFERRFEARHSPSPLASPRASSPAFLNAHSRQVSLLSQISQVSSQEGDAAETPQAPWDVVRWTKLKKITGQAFSEVGKRNFGRPTCLAVSATIAVGTSKGLILVFDYHQTLKNIIGQGTPAAEAGSVTSLAISADHATIAGGHANGYIFTWDIVKPARPFLQIAPLERVQLQRQPHPDGHVRDAAVLHLGFLGTRHTALVSADAGGMAFAHLATRGLGPVARTVKTTRLLGRYPPAVPQAEQTRKPSSVLAFSPLPLGNVEQSTDGMGLTALLTPYLLVIVSTTPIAQTQHKSARPKDISPHSALSGCLAWFPAVKLKSPAGDADRTASDTKLVYCWSNVLTVLDVKAIENPDPAKPPSLEFHPRSRWRAEESIVAVQWLSRSVLGILTISQRLLILEDGTLRMTDSIDLLQKHISHQDLFSRQLRMIVEHLDPEEPSLHGVIADAFYMSYRVYKGRVFLLGFNDVSVGTLSNWADRLLALMEAGDHTAAIQLATTYYAGSANNVTVGLPDDNESRHALVKGKIVEMITASLQYSMSENSKRTAGGASMRELADECFSACVSMDETDFLFEEVYDWFESADEEVVFVRALEPYILDGDIATVPPPIVKSLVSHYISENQGKQLEELLCRLDPHSFDLDQITTLCRQHNLYDALIYVWTQALGDYVTPLVDLLSLVKMLQGDNDGEHVSDNPFIDSAMKVFPYLAYSLTSRRYPGGRQMDESEALQAKADVYEYLFAGTSVPWPPGSRKIFHAVNDGEDEPAFPYLDLLLHFDAASFMSMLNEAFEDSFLNTAGEQSDTPNGQLTNGNGNRPGFKMTRQHIISIMLEIMSEDTFEPEDTIYLDMFIARSLSKYPQHLILSGTLLNNILRRLCEVPASELAEDCQLSVEYLLSVYHPPNIQALIKALSQARFFRVLKTIYRSQKLYSELLTTYLDDPSDKETVFGCITECLHSSAALSEKQVAAVKKVISGHYEDLANINTIHTARTLASYATDLLEPCLNALQDTQTQFVFLRSLMEPSRLRESSEIAGLQPAKAEVRSAFTERYVRLMCSHDPSHVADYVGLLDSGDIRLSQVLPAMENSGVVDAAVVLLARDGLAHDAMDRLVRHLHSLAQTLTSLIDAAAESPDVASTQEAVEDLLEAIEKYSKVGIWLCQGQSATAQLSRRPRPRTNLAWDIKEDDLELDEFLWLNLLDAVVAITKRVNAILRHDEDHPSEAPEDVVDGEKISASLRSNVQQCFTALLAATAAPNAKKGDRPTQDGAKRSVPKQDHQSFLRVLRAFLTRATLTAPSLSDLRAVLADIFSAYAFESGVLSLANHLLGSDVFTDIQEANQLRQRGWRPRTQVCEKCKRRAWGNGIGEIVWDEWVAREQEREAVKARKAVERGGGEEAKRLERGKAKAKADAVMSGSEEDDEERRKLTLVVFACRHVFHRVCLDGNFRNGRPPSSELYKCPLCTEDT